MQKQFVKKWNHGTVCACVPVSMHVGICVSVCLCEQMHVHDCVFVAFFMVSCRCTSTDSTDSTLHKPLPQVVAHKLLGGVDQATLRQSLTRGDSDQLRSTHTNASNCDITCDDLL